MSRLARRRGDPGAGDGLTGVLDQLAADRRAAGERFFAAEATRIARLCHQMAERFSSGGRLLAAGRSPVARSDARHVAVEFVHPVIVGKRALPALALCGEGGPITSQVELVARPGDIFVIFGLEAGCPAAPSALAAAKAKGCLTIGFAPCEADWVFTPPNDDLFLHQELTETLYHLLWELVHVFFDHRGLLAGRDVRQVHDAGASSFLYPFLAEDQHDLEAVVADVAASVRLKSDEIGALRTQTLVDNDGELRAAGAALRAALDAGGTLFALGNGGSATDAMDAVADFRTPPAATGWPARRALDLTEDPAILTAIANDVGIELVFARQVIAYGGPGDVVMALSTSGNSTNVIAALAEARRQGLATIAMVGYDGGQVLADRLADHVIVTRSEHIPRIQEAQATALHALRELVEEGPEASDRLREQAPDAPAARTP